MRIIQIGNCTIYSFYHLFCNVMFKIKMKTKILNALSKTFSFRDRCKRRVCQLSPVHLWTLPKEIQYLDLGNYIMFFDSGSIRSCTYHPWKQIQPCQGKIYKYSFQRFACSSLRHWIYNHRHNILRLYNTLPNFLFATSETKHDY